MRAADVLKYLGICSPALRRYFHCHGRRRHASRYHMLLVFPEETEEREGAVKVGNKRWLTKALRTTTTHKKTNICKCKGRPNLLVWLRTLVRCLSLWWSQSAGIILPKDGRWHVFCCDELRKKRGSDTIKGFREVGNPTGTKHSFCPLHLYTCPHSHTPN